MDDEDCGESTEATLVLCYRQRLEKSTGGEVVLMEWSPTMDVLATALANHSVSLYNNIHHFNIVYVVV